MFCNVKRTKILYQQYFFSGRTIRSCSTSRYKPGLATDMLLQPRALSLKDRIMESPFHKKLEKGTLPIVCMRYFLEQDTQFLLKILSMLNSENGCFDESSRPIVSRLERGMLKDLLKMNSLKKAYDVKGSSQLESPFLDYINHLDRVINKKNKNIFIAGFMPCSWSFQEFMARKIEHDLSTHPYRLWLKDYGSKVCSQTLTDLMDEMNATGNTLSNKEKEMVKRIFIESLEYEVAIWKHCHEVGHRGSNLA